MQELKLTKKYQTYPEYKDSGIEWVGTLPESWEVVSTRRLFSTKKKQVGDLANEYKVLSLTLNGVIPRILDGSGKNPADYATYQEFKKQDLVFCLFDYDVTPRTIGYVAEDGMLTGAYTRLIPKQETCAKYFYYYFLYLDYTKELLHLCTGLRNSIPKPLFWSMRNPLPPVSVQESIARYLDEKTGLIDQIIAKKKKLIELLREKRAAVINHAVTKGLDPKAELVKCVLPWIDSFPQSWRLYPNKSFLRKRKYLVGNRHETLPLLSLTKQGVVVRDVTEGKGKFSEDMSSFQIVEPGNLIFCLFDVEETPRTVGLSRSHGMITGAYTLFEISDPVLARFIEYFYIAIDEHKNLSYFYSGLRNTIAPPRFLRIQTPIPPSEIQKDIIEYLDKQVSDLDRFVKATERSVGLMQEFKSSLISHAVTGKINITL